jgi:23S rRNA (adenine2503-C2)-methyltransferase
MRIVATHGNDSLARVYVGELPDRSRIEFVESTQPPVPRERKWVLIVSTLKGCPIRCPICDAGGDYRGKLSAAEILAQIDYLVRRRYPDGIPAVDRLKIQFARMGDPMLNEAVLDVLEALPARYGDRVMPSISTVAPHIRPETWDRMLAVKERSFAAGRFQLQFSLHTTDESRRRELVPARTWSFAEMAAHGERFYRPGDRKVTLNFATPAGYALDPQALRRVFDPACFLVKLTPVNPTGNAGANGLVPLIDPAFPDRCMEFVRGFEEAGFDTILSIGELDENRIGSNCGMYVSRLADAKEATC